MTLSKLDIIRGAAKAFAYARAKLYARVARLKAVQDAAHRRHMPLIRAAVAGVADCEANLKAALRAAPELFVEPRSITEAGIKCGYQRHDASIDLPKAAAAVECLVAAIEREFSPAEIKTLGLVRTVKLPVADKLLEHLTPKQLAKLGIEYTPAGDHLLVKPADAAVDKLVAKILKAAVDENSEGKEAA